MKDEEELNVSINEMWEQFPALGEQENTGGECRHPEISRSQFLGKEERSLQSEERAGTPQTHQGPGQVHSE